MRAKMINYTLILLVLANAYFISGAISNRDGRLEITILDVGQGDSILIRSPDNRFGLIDGGRGTAVIDELAKAMPFGQREFEFVIATHPDADHIEGLLAVIRHYTVRRIFWEQNQKESIPWDQLKQLVDSEGIPNYELNSDNDFRLGCCVDFDVVWPTPDFDTFHVADTNEVSLSAVIHYGLFRMFSGGDLPLELEDKVASQIPHEDNTFSVLKVSHHGSKNSTSSNFLNFLGTQMALISVGKGNSYGHPATEIIRRLEELKITTYRTDDEGEIFLTSDGQDIAARTAKGL